MPLFLRMWSLFLLSCLTAWRSIDKLLWIFLRYQIYQNDWIKKAVMIPASSDAIGPGCRGSRHPVEAWRIHALCDQWSLHIRIPPTPVLGRRIWIRPVMSSTKLSEIIMLLLVLEFFSGLMIVAGWLAWCGPSEMFPFTVHLTWFSEMLI